MFSSKSHLLLLAMCCCHIFLTVALIDCDDAIQESTFTGQCNNKWKNLKSIIKRKLFSIFLPFFH